MTTLNTITMTTVEIAAMTGKRHDNVLRDADRAIELVNKSRASNLRSQVGNSEVASDLRASIDATEGTFENRGKQYRMLVLNKHMVFTIITGYDTALRHTVIGRWIELEQAANPAFASQAITETLNDLQTRVDAMAPAYDEHVRKGRSVGYSWREACRLAGIDHPDKLMALMIRYKKARKNLHGHTEINPSYVKKGYVTVLKPSNLIVKANGGHLFKVTSKGLTEWLSANACEINASVLEANRPKAVVDDQGFTVDITGDNTSGMTTRSLH